MKQIYIDRFHDLVKLEKLKSQEGNVRQERGNRFESLMQEVFEYEGILIKKGFHTSDNRSEQIDGAIEVWNRVLILEVKWVTKNLAASDLFAFIGKIENKFQGTLGLFISRNELSENFISTLSRGRRQSVVVFHGKDIDLYFKKDNPPFSDYLEHCLKLFSYDNRVHYPYADYVDLIKSTTVLSENSNLAHVEFINDYLNSKDDISLALMMDAYDGLSQKGRKEVLEYALAYFRVVVYGPAASRFAFTPYNYLKYFNILNKDSTEIEGTERYYFLSKLTNYFKTYGRKELTKLYLPRYADLSQENKITFEKQLFTKLRYAYNFNDPDDVDTISGIVEQLWQNLMPETQFKLKEFYTYLATSTEYVNRTSGDFAHQLLQRQIISKEALQSWLLNKLADYASAFDQHADLVHQFLWSFSKLHPYLGMDLKDFQEFVSVEAKKFTD